MTINVTAIIPAGGVGHRMGRSTPKQFLEVAGLPVLVHTVRALQGSPSVNAIILVAPEDHLEKTSELVAAYHLTGVVKIVAGGVTRQDSVRAGLDNLPEETGYVLVHDCARALIDSDLIENCIAAAIQHGAAIAAMPAGDTLKEAGESDTILRTVDRSSIWQAQTPQVAKVELMQAAFSSADAEGFIGTDEASLLERSGVEVALVAGSSRNLKITGPDDLLLAEALLGSKNNGVSSMANLRVGQGYDAHRLVEGRDLILGGVKIDHDKGLLGHSDADVLLHALMDALLGAAALGDIGHHFPDSDPQYKGVSSIVLLEKVVSLLSGKNYRLVNCDVTVIAQKPRISPYISEMSKIVSRACGVDIGDVNIKATTTEEMGFIGREEGIAAQATVLLRKQGDETSS